MNPKTRKIILSNVPYVFVALFATKLGLAWRLAEGADASEKVLSLLRLCLHELSGIMALSQRRGCHHGEITASA